MPSGPLNGEFNTPPRGGGAGGLTVTTMEATLHRTACSRRIRVDRQSLTHCARG